MHVFFSACSTSYLLMSHDQQALLKLTKNRALVICSVNCSALLNYSRPGKGWRLPFSPSPSPSSIPLLAVFCFQDMEWKTGWKPLRHRSVRVTVSFTRRWMIIIPSRLFPLSRSVCASALTLFMNNIQRQRSGRCTVTCSLTGTHTHTHSFSLWCLKLACILKVSTKHSSNHISDPIYELPGVKHSGDISSLAIFGTYWVKWSLVMCQTVRWWFRLDGNWWATWKWSHQ